MSLEFHSQNSLPVITSQSISEHKCNGTEYSQAIY